MKIFEIEIDAKNPSMKEIYCPSNSDLGISIDINDTQTKLVPTGVFDDNGDIIEPTGYLETDVVPFYTLHTKDEGFVQKFHVEYTVENDDKEQVAMDFYININCVKSGFSYFATAGGGASDVTKAYVDEKLGLKQDNLTDKNQGSNITITNENGVTKINATDTKPNVDKNYVDTELAKKQDKLTSLNAGTNVDITTDSTGKVKINSKLPDNIKIPTESKIEMGLSSEFSMGDKYKCSVLSASDYAPYIKLSNLNIGKTVNIMGLPEGASYKSTHQGEDFIKWSGNAQTATLSSGYSNSWSIGNSSTEELGVQGYHGFIGDGSYITQYIGLIQDGGNRYSMDWKFNTKTNKLELVIDNAGNVKRFEVTLTPVM